MSIIYDPVMTDEVQWKFDGRFCEYEALWKGETRICCAHLSEGRVFECWCSSLKDAKTATEACAHRCEDAKEPTDA